jgi:hypothetical protein
MAPPKLTPRTEKRCPRCDTVKPVDDFYRNRSASDGRQGYCKPCWTEKAKTSNFRATGRYYHRGHHLRKMYGITVAEYDAMLAESGGKCWVCGEAETATHPKTGTLFSLAVDHDHDTGEVRGLLCFVCNKTIRSTGDDRGRLMALIQYLDTRSPVKFS